MRELMLAVRGLTAGYGEVRVLRGVDFTVEAGQVVVLMGPNGAGKSTLLKAIFNLVSVTGGEIGYRGQRLRGLAPHDLIRLGIGYVPQGRVNFGTLTVRENLRMGVHFMGRRAHGESLERVLTVFPQLEGWLSARAFTLSGGQQQVLALARALMHRPDLLLLDEPSLGLSPRLVKEVFAHIHRINKAFSTAVLIVEHNIRSVLDIADYGLVMVGGRIAAADTPARLRDSATLEQVFVGTLE